MAASSSAPARLVATCSDVVRTWELEREPALRPRIEVQTTGRAAGQGPWHCVKWNHNNQVLACGGDRGAVVLLHESGKVLEVLFEGGGDEVAGPGAGHAPTPVVSLAWGGRSRYLCTSGGASRRPTLWDLKRKQKLRAFRGHGSSTVTAVAFAPDDSGVASGNNHGEILLHQLQSEQPALVLPFDPSSQQQANLGPRGLMSPSAISASVRTVEYWAMRPPLVLAGYRNGDARIWDAAAGACVGSFKGQHQAAVTGVVGSPVNNKLLATAGLDRRVLLFDANSRKLLRECRAPAPVHALAFVPEGDALVVGCGNGELAVYDLRKPNIPCVSIAAHAGGQPVRALAVQGSSINPTAAAAAASSGGVLPTTTTSSSVTSAAATSASAASQPPEAQQPQAAPASSASSPKTSVGSAGAPQAKPMSPSRLSSTAAAATAAAAKPLSAPVQPAPTTTGSGGAARPVAIEPPASTSTSTSTASTTAGLNLRPTTATQATTGAAAARAVEPPQPPASFESGFRWRDDNRRAAGGEAAAGAGGGAGAAGGEKATATKPSLDVTPSSSSFPAPSLSASAGHPLPPPHQQQPPQPGVPSAAQPPPAAAGGGGAAVPAAGAVIGIGVAASPKEVAALVEERVKDVVDEMKDELGRGLKGLHLELLRGQEGTQEAVTGLAAAVARLCEENRQLRAELAEMRALGY